MPLWSPQISQSPLPTHIPPSLPRTFSANLLCPPPSKFPNTFYAQPLKLSDYFPRTFQNPHPITVLAHLTTTQTLTPEKSKNCPRTFQELSKNFPRNFQELSPPIPKPSPPNFLPPSYSQSCLYLSYPRLSSAYSITYSLFSWLFITPLKLSNSCHHSWSLHGVFKDPPPPKFFLIAPPPHPKTCINNYSLGLAPRKTHAFCTPDFFKFFGFCPEVVPDERGGLPLAS